MIILQISIAYPDPDVGDGQANAKRTSAGLAVRRMTASVPLW